MHDKETKSIIPISQFISCCHNTIWISKQLFFIKSIMQHQIRNQLFSVAPIIVTDMSWALITSIHVAFNGCTVIQYLRWTFDLITRRKQDIELMMNVRSYFCAVHFLKTIARNAKIKIKDLNKNILKTFIFAFTLLQNSISLEKFETNLKYIFHIFNSKSQNELFVDSLTRIRSQLANRDIDIDAIIGEIKPENGKKIITNENTIFEQELSVTLKKESPYTNHFNSIIEKCKIICENAPESKEENSFFQPMLFHVIQDYLHLTPFWSGIIICSWQMFKYKEIKFTRLDNNPVENHFGYIKNNLIPRNSMPSQFSSLMYEMIQTKYFLHYHTEEATNRKPKKIPENVERWKRDQIFRREKGFYYKNFPNFGRFENSMENQNEIGFDTILSSFGNTTTFKPQSLLTFFLFYFFIFFKSLQKKLMKRVTSATKQSKLVNKTNFI